MPASLADRWQRAVMGDAPPAGLGTAALRALAAGAGRLYENGLDVYLDWEQLGLRKRQALPVPVISIGNLTAGGTGKTPMTRLVCRLLGGANKRVAILSRGHGGKGAGVRLVSDAQGNIARSAADAGDEPLLLARSLPGVPVLVGKDRRLSGREALRRFALDALVLDDGFQYWQLARELDIVLVDARRPFDNGHCLPRGLLREPPRHLNRAGVVVATRSENRTPAEQEALRVRLGGLAPDAALFFARHAATGFVSLADPDRRSAPLETLRGRRVVAWSAIARPDSFARTLEETGAEIAAQIVRPDHYTPTEADAAEARATLSQFSAEMIVMTEKDAVKWPGESDAGFVRVEMQVEDEEGFWAKVRERVFKERRNSAG